MLQLNMQPPEKPVMQEDGSLEVHSVFLTVQGEGPFTGCASIFIRLAGCNLECASCDTDYTSRRELLTPRQIMAHVKLLCPERIPVLFVLTGGEPFRQNIGPLIEFLLMRSLQVQIETNGTLWPKSLDYHDDLFIVCSPKTPNIHPNIARNATVFKYVLDAEHVDPNDGLPTESVGSRYRPYRPWASRVVIPEIYVQTLAEQDRLKNKRNLEACIEACLKYDYRLSCQLHKIIGVE